ncbi:MAG: GHKL domain-containing protein [Bacteroidales bacterium]|nr:GHKL domain-containing protein [Bacteroidales bacterium]NPV36580.1 GHKL domain-containing protein [Bacteroidales bacterium]
MDTFFASPDRAPDEVLRQDLQAFEQFAALKQFFNALPFIAAVLNKERQLVYSNRALLDAMGFPNIEAALGRRPGEWLNCIHAKETPGGCGTSESCQYCGAINAILSCLRTGERSQGECRITGYLGDKEVSYDFWAVASPITFNEKFYVVLSIADISHEKRRLALERIFFHDILNTAGGLRGFLEFVQMTDDMQEIKEHVDTATRLSDDLIDEIVAQRQLLSAERGDLKVEWESIPVIQMLENVRSHMSFHLVAKGRYIRLDPPSSPLPIVSDIILLKRVLVNLVKNALEAIPEGETVVLGADIENDRAIFRVHNPGVIPKNIQLQLFQRSFSTKEKTRGLGTYSVKLLTEQYLGGKVSFKSTPETGTIFYVELPLKPLS